MTYSANITVSFNEAPANAALRRGEPVASNDVVGGFVFLAYYWTGFTDDVATVLAICDSRHTANEVLREHKRTRDAGLEYGHRANWWVRRERIRTANAAVEARRNAVASNDVDLLQTRLVELLGPRP